MDGPVVKWRDLDRFLVYTGMRLDDGTPARRADEMPRPEKPFRLELPFPNLWQNWISDKVHVVAAFTPLDEEDTVLYLRFYQSTMRTTVLRSVVHRLELVFNTVVAHQDRRVVVTQRPPRSFLRMGEKVIPGDSPVVG
jgi:hypothetical protein